MFGLAQLFVYVFLLSFQHFDHFAWRRGSWILCSSCISLLDMHTLICVTFFLFLLVSWVSCDFCSACGSSWNFLICFSRLHDQLYVICGLALKMNFENYEVAFLADLPAIHWDKITSCARCVYPQSFNIFQPNDITI